MIWSRVAKAIPPCLEFIRLPPLRLRLTARPIFEAVKFLMKFRVLWKLLSCPELLKIISMLPKMRRQLDSMVLRFMVPTAICWIRFCKARRICALIITEVSFFNFVFCTTFNFDNLVSATCIYSANLTVFHFLTRFNRKSF